MKTQQANAMKLARPTRHRDSSYESPCDDVTSEASHSNGPASEASRCDDLARSRRHHDSSDESPCDDVTSEASHRDGPASEASRCDETGAAAAPPQFVRRIAVDHRETRSGVPEALANHPDVELSVRRLKLGDYRIDDLIVERKTLFDFTHSVKDGRLFTQVASMARQRTKRVCLIIEGTTKTYPHLSIPATALRGALVTVTIVFCVPILRSTTPQETADLILYAAHQLGRRNSRPPRRFATNIGNLARQQRFMLQAIPEIGPIKAAELLRVFGSPAGIATAPIEDLRIADGIGESAAKKIYSVFHGIHTCDD